MTLIPITAITFFVARFIPIHPAVFGAIAFGVTLFVIAVVFRFRDHDDSMDVPALIGLVETIAYLVGFVNLQTGPFGWFALTMLKIYPPDPCDAVTYFRIRS